MSDYAHHYQSHKKNRPRISYKWKIFTGLFLSLIILLISAANIFVYLPYFQIKQIRVEIIDINLFKGEPDISQKIEKLTNNILQEKKWKIIPKKNFFLASISKIQADILSNYSEIKNIEITKKLNQGLTIKVDGWQSVGIWCQLIKAGSLDESGFLGEEAATTTKESQEEAGNKEGENVGDCFYIDDNGVIFKPAPKMIGGLVTAIFDSTDNTPQIKEQVVSKEMIDYVLNLKKQIPGIKSGLGVDSFKIISRSDLLVKTSENWQIYFNTTISINGQLSALRLILEEEIKDTTNLEYVDLRVEGRVYYR